MPPGASVATLNQLCATKFRVTQPEAFGLFLYKEQGYHRLPPGALAHRLPSTGYLVYRRQAERSETHGASLEAATEEGSREPEAGGREEEKGGRENGNTEVKASPRDSGGESETTAEWDEGQARGGPAQPGVPEAEGSRAAEE